MKDWFKARNIWGAAILTLSDAEAGRLMKALWSYTMTGEQPNLSGAEKGIFALILMTLSQDDSRESEISEKRAQAGSIGGKQKVANQANANFATNEEANQANATNKNKNKNIDIKETTLTCSKEKRKHFSPPTLEEVTAYCKERGNTINPQYFIDYYSTRGWQLSKGQNVRDWKACIRTWEQRDNNPSQVQKPKLLRAQMYQQRDYNEAEMQKILGVDDLYISDEEYMRRYGVHSPYVDKEEHAG